MNMKRFVLFLLFFMAGFGAVVASENGQQWVAEEVICADSS